MPPNSCCWLTASAQHFHCYMLSSTSALICLRGFGGVQHTGDVGERAAAITHPVPMASHSSSVVPRCIDRDGATSYDLGHAPIVLSAGLHRRLFIGEHKLSCEP